MTPPHLKSKRKKTAILLTHPSLKQFVPETVPFSYSHLQTMISQYPIVFVKPDHGRFGKGVMKIVQRSNGYTLHYLRQVHPYKSLADLHVSINKRRARKKYIIQQGIQMLTYQGRPFDIRVMVQRMRNNKWKTTGMLARVAAPGKVVTNFHAGGAIHPLPSLLTMYMSKSQRLKMLRTLRGLGRKVARHYSSHLHGLHEVGVDVALDGHFKPWILEVNTRPDAFVFNELSDKTMFRNIMKYAWQYGKYTTSRKSRRERL